MGNLDAAWSKLHDAKPPGWFVGRPSYDEGLRMWEQYAFDPTEVEVIRELARCLRVIREGRVPE